MVVVVLNIGFMLFCIDCCWVCVCVVVWLFLGMGDSCCFIIVFYGTFRNLTLNSVRCFMQIYVFLIEDIVLLIRLIVLM